MKRIIKELVDNNKNLVTGNLKEYLSDIMKRTDYLHSSKLSERCYHIYYDMYELPKCKCGNHITSFLRFKDGYRSHCSVSCSVKFYKHENPELELERIDKIKNSFIHMDYNLKLQKAHNIVNTRIKNGHNLDPKCYEDFKYYHRMVWKLTNRNDLNVLPFCELRGRADEDENAHHLDHILSIKDGFLKNIPVYIISNINNLRFIHFSQNCSKNSKSDIDIDELWSEMVRNDLNLW